jgi:2-methylisocitrate lyase-like PEP mutase family enzyme
LTQKEKAELLLKYHHDDEVLVLVNSWDTGSSLLIQATGFKAVATTSMGIAASLGYPDGQKIPFTEMLEAIQRITDKVSIPVTADIEGGYGSNTQEITGSIEKIINTGIAGINIEDSDHLNPGLLDADEFCERISAIRKLSKSLGFHLVINARTDVFLAETGSPNGRIAESIRRGNKYREAGADCIFVPCVWEEEMISELVKGINAPINILCNPTNGTGLPPSIEELKNLGVARLSVGSSVMKSTLALIKNVGEEMLQKGTYNNYSNALTPVENVKQAYQMATSANKN